MDHLMGNVEYTIQHDIFKVKRKTSIIQLSKQGPKMEISIGHDPF